MAETLWRHRLLPSSFPGAPSLDDDAQAAILPPTCFTGILGGAICNTAVTRFAPVTPPVHAAAARHHHVTCKTAGRDARFFIRLPVSYLCLCALYTKRLVGHSPGHVGRIAALYQTIGHNAFTDDDSSSPLSTRAF